MASKLCFRKCYIHELSDFEGLFTFLEGPMMQTPERGAHAPKFIDVAFGGGAHHVSLWLDGDTSWPGG